MTAASSKGGQQLAEMPPITSTEFDERRLATRFLRGSGIEIGALQRPIELNPAYCSVTYLDHFSASQLRERFPELGDEEITSPDVICDVVASGLSCIQDGRLDFVIASHLLEHLPNPLGFLLECHRVLRVAGVLLLIVPDKNYTFDKDRERTPIAHLIDDLKNNTTAVDEEHVIDFVVNAAKQSIPADPEVRKAMLQRELDRSIHVHVWDCADLLELLEYLVRAEASSWELCECYLPKGITNESVLVLRKTAAQKEQALAHFQENAVMLAAREASLAAPKASLAVPAMQPLLLPPQPRPTPLPKRLHRRAMRLANRVLLRREEPVTSERNGRIDA